MLFVAVLAMWLDIKAQNYDFSAEAPSGQTLYYKIVDGHAEVVSRGYDYVEGDVVIPATVDYDNTTYDVTKIADVDYRGAFEGCENLTSITIPASITSIGYWAFYDCSNLTSVNYTGTIAQWCRIDFRNDYANPINITHSLNINGNHISNLVIPNDVIEIKKYAFCGCSSLQSVTIGSGVSTIGFHAFRDCSSLQSVTIGSGVSTIGSYAFYGCSNLTSISLPNGVTTIVTVNTPLYF